MLFVMALFGGYWSHRLRTERGLSCNTNPVVIIIAYLFSCVCIALFIGRFFLAVDWAGLSSAQRVVIQVLSVISGMAVGLLVYSHWHKRVPVSSSNRNV